MVCLFVSSVGQVRSSLPRNKLEVYDLSSECPRIEVLKGGFAAVRAARSADFMGLKLLTRGTNIWKLTSKKS